METSLLEVLVTLGIPGVALGIFYLLLRSFKVRFDIISSTWAAIIAIVFLLVVGGITFYGLQRFSPNNTNSSFAGEQTPPTRLQDDSDKFLQLWVTKDIKDIFEAYVPQSWYSIYSLKDYSKFDSTQIKSELSKRNLILFNTIPYNLSIKTEQDALAFFALNYTLQNSTPERNAKKLMGLKLGQLFKTMQYFVIVDNAKEDTYLQYKNTVSVKIGEYLFDVVVQVIFLSKNASVDYRIFPAILKEMQKDPMSLLVTNYKADKTEKLVKLKLIN
ncbi:MAG: hypothetical protein D3915_05770 [Candidatus Electrothrix sp. AU1_5]|nr:hypothetical protein [Candidatus Electrothrix gigas]